MLSSQRLELGPINKLGPIRKLPKLFLHDTRNTYVTCPVCRGTKCNTTAHENGTASIFYCSCCQGTGIIFNGD